MNEIEKEFLEQPRTQDELKSIGYTIANAIRREINNEHIDNLDEVIIEYISNIWSRYTKKELKQMAEDDMDIDTREEGWEEDAFENMANVKASKISDEFKERIVIEAVIEALQEML